MVASRWQERGGATHNHRSGIARYATVVARELRWSAHGSHWEKTRGGNLTPVDQFQGKSTGGTWRGEMWVGDKIKMIFLRYVSKNAYFCNLKYFVDYEEIYIDSRIVLYCIHR
jgi:hypothetical protein